ncbi:MAG: WD40/YVTN/BNR-like repeat-containing protein [Gemmatimonadaceae bacterium]
MCIVLRVITARARDFFIAVLLASTVVSLTPSLAEAQRAAAAGGRPALTGIWEPVSYSEDLDLTDVFFVTTNVGWVSGAGGTLLHTRDGGDNWTVVLGGDPASPDAQIEKLRFLDERHGWAVQGRKLLRTTDGESWEDFGATPVRMGDYVFLTPLAGVAAAGTSEQSAPDHVFRTEDGGRTWNQVAPCAVKVNVDGLNRNVQCQIVRLHFPTPTVGYLVGKTTCVGMGCGGPPMFGRTRDGGRSWQFVSGPGDPKTADLEDLFFIDERRGYVHVREGDAHKLYATSDGGETWRARIATPAGLMRFADPEVGWSLDLDWAPKINFTTDGGQRWTSRQLRFPAWITGWSFPRRDRAYVVGQHGMVFRYRMVPAGASQKQGSIAAPVMPAFGSGLVGEAAQAEALATELLPVLDKAVTPAGNTRPSDSSFAARCCGPSVNKLGVIITTIAGTVPTFLAKYRNVNLLGAGLRMQADLPARYSELRQAIGAFQSATTKPAAQEALVQVQGALQRLHQSSRVAFQREIP